MKGSCKVVNFPAIHFFYLDKKLATGSRQLRPNQPSLTLVSLSLFLNRLKVFNPTWEILNDPKEVPSSTFWEDPRLWDYSVSNVAL